MKKISLFSALLMLVSTVAFADIAKNDSNPICDNDTIGATSGDTALDAEWTANTLNLKFMADGVEFASGTCTYNQNITIPQGTPSKTGYNFAGWVLSSNSGGSQEEPQQSGFDWSLLTANVSSSGSSQRYKSNNGNGGNGSNYNELSAGQWEAGFSYGTIHGFSYCSNKGGSNNDQNYTNDSSNWVASQSDVTAATGGSCWCQITGFTPYGESEEQEAISRIVFYRDTGSDSNCGWDCARDCSDRIRYNQSLRTALFAAE